MNPKSYKFTGGTTGISGPMTLQGNYHVDEYSDRFISIRHVRTAYGNLTIETFLDEGTPTELEEVQGFLDITSAGITSLDHLTIVKKNLWLPLEDSVSFPKLEVIGGMIRGTRAIPFLPSLKYDTFIELPNMYFVSTEEYSYRQAAIRVLDTDLTDLIPMREEEPKYRHLIDARLRGDLKREGLCQK